MSDIVINGQTYSGIDTITVNKASGGTTKYTEGERPSGTIEITENGTHNVADYESANVNVKTEPNLETKSITQNGTYNASDDGDDGWDSVEVTVPVPDLSQTTATADDVLEGKEFYNASGEKVAGTYKDMLQRRVDTEKGCVYLFYKYDGDNVDFIKNLDTSNVGTMAYMFQSCTKLTTIPALDMSNVSNATYMFQGCTKLTTIPALNTPKLSVLNYTFQNCTSLETIELLDMRNVTANISSMFTNCKNLTNLTLKNIRITLQIGSGTSYGHLLTLDSLLNTIKELWTNTGTSTKTLTIGSANLEKLADVYVKLIPITDEMRVEDEYIDNKAPFVQCESTDEGAMLITEYVTTVKNWQLA